LLLGTVLTVLVLLLLASGVIYYVAVSGQENVPQLANRLIEEETGLELECDFYQFNYLDHFPFLSLQMEQVRLKGMADSTSQRPFLQVGNLSLVFQPRQLLDGQFEVRTLVLQDGNLFLYREADGQRNTDFPSRKDGEGKSPHFQLSDIRLKNIQLEYLDSLKLKHHKVRFEEGSGQLVTEGGLHQLRLRSECHFDGLLFNPEKGPYLDNMPGKLDVEITMDTSAQQLTFKPSVLSVNGLDVQLDGYLEMQDSGYLEFNITHPAVALEKGLPILTPHLRSNLSRYTADAPFEVKVQLAGRSGMPGKTPLKARFATQNARLGVKKLWVSQARLSGHYDNKCRNRPEAQDTAKCLQIELEEGLIFGKFPISATIKEDGIKATPLEVEGVLDASMLAFNNYLPAQSVQFKSGRIHFPFKIEGDPTLFFNGGLEKEAAKIGGTIAVKDARLSYLPSNLTIKNITAQLRLAGQNLAVDTLGFNIGAVPYVLKGMAYDFIPMALRQDRQLDAHLQLSLDTLNLDRFFPKDNEPNQPDSISLQALQEFSRSAAVTLAVDAQALVFRKLAVNDTHFTAQLISNCSEEKGSACIQIPDFRGTVYDSIDLEASIAATNLSHPWINMNLALAAPLTHFARLSPPKLLVPLAGQLKLDMDFEGRLSDYFGLEEGVLRGAFSGMASLSDAAINYLPRNYKMKELNAGLHFDENQLFVDSLMGSLNGNQLNVDGYVNGFLPFLFEVENAPPLWANLNIQTPKLDFGSLKSKADGSAADSTAFQPTIVTRSIKKLAEQIEGALYVEADEMIFRSFNMTEVCFNAELFQSCDAPNEDKSCVDIDAFEARLWGSAPLNAVLQITGLRNPFFEAEVEAALPFAELNRMFRPGEFRFLSGDLMVDFTYEGYPDDQFDVKENILKAAVQGDASIKGGNLSYLPRGYEFRNMNGNFSFDQQGLKIHHLQAVLNRNQLEVDGSLPNFMPFLLEPGQRLDANLNLKSPHFSFDEFKAPQKFAGREKGEAAAPTQFSNIVDVALEQIKARFSVSLDTVTYLNFRAGEVDGVFTMRPDFMRFDDVSMQLASGRLALNGQVSGLEENQPEIGLRAKFREVDIQEVFTAFDNFGQEQLLAQNIEGRLNADIQFQTKGNANYDLYPEAHRGSFHLELSHGALKEFAPLQAMSGFMFKKRNMDHVQFANLENTFTLEGQQLKIDHFYVISNVLDFGMQGIYSLGEEEETELLFEVPISNLFRRNLEIRDSVSTPGRSKSFPILLEATEEENGELDFDFRLFRGKWAKKH